MTRTALIVVLPILATALSGGADERILSYHSHIVVHPDASLTVTETLRVRAEGERINHGIYRDFPQLYRGRWGLRLTTGFEVAGITRDGRPEPYHTELRSNGQRVYIGDKDSQVTPGEHTYKLTYQTDRQLGFFTDHDELYWNVTGNDWAFPIDQASATVELPRHAEPLSVEAYTGRQGEKGRDYGVNKSGPAGPTLTTTRALAAGEGFTIVVTWPKNFVQPPDRDETLRRLVLDNRGLFLAAVAMLAVILYYLVTWSLYGKDPPPGIIIPLYGPPDDFSPPAVRYLHKMGFDNKTFAAAIIDLAVKGKVAIHEEKDKIYRLERLSGVTTDLDEAYRAVMDKLFKSSADLALKPANHYRVSAGIEALKNSLSKRLETTYFVRNLRFWFPGLLFSLGPMAVSLLDSAQWQIAGFLILWLSIWSIGVTVLVSMVCTQFRARQYKPGFKLALFALPFVLGEVGALTALFFNASPWVTVSFGGGILLNGMFYHLLKAPTLLGRKVLDRIDGFKLYLSVAEKDRLNLENPPERTPQLFERFLPYALALDVEQEWAEQFSEVLEKAGRSAAQPVWYHGGSVTTMTSGAFAGALSGAFTGAIVSSSTAPGSSSGSSGGGSSGGGGGGGGGGGW